MLLVSFILLSVHQVPSSATSVSVLVLWWFEAESDVQDGLGDNKQAYLDHVSSKQRFLAEIIPAGSTSGQAQKPFSL